MRFLQWTTVKILTSCTAKGILSAKAPAWEEAAGSGLGPALQPVEGHGTESEALFCCGSSHCAAASEGLTFVDLRAGSALWEGAFHMAEPRDRVAEPSGNAKSGRPSLPSPHKGQECGVLRLDLTSRSGGGVAL